MNKRVHQMMKLKHQYQHLNFSVLFPEVSHGEWILLVAVKKQREDNAGEMPPHPFGPGDFAKMLECSPPMISKMLRSLEKKGMLVRETDKADRRNTNIFLTEQGEELLLEGKERMDCLFERVIAKFGEEQVDKMLVAMEEFYQVVKEELEEK